MIERGDMDRLDRDRVISALDNEWEELNSLLSVSRHFHTVPLIERFENVQYIYTRSELWVSHVVAKYTYNQTINVSRLPPSSSMGCKIICLSIDFIRSLWVCRVSRLS